MRLFVPLSCALLTVALASCSSQRGAQVGADSTIAASETTPDIEWGFIPIAAERERVRRFVSSSVTRGLMDSTAVAVVQRFSEDSLGARYLLMTFAPRSDTLRGRRPVVLIALEAPGEGLAAASRAIGIDTIGGWAYEVVRDRDGDGRLDVSVCDFTRGAFGVARTLGHRESGWYEIKSAGIAPAGCRPPSHPRA